MSPSLPGVYAWFLEDVPVYAGKASGVRGIRGRLSKHLAIGLDLSRSSLRRNVADYVLGILTAVTRARPTRVTEGDVAVVNDWIRQLTVCWLVLPSGKSVASFERDLFAEWMPPLGRR